MHIGEVLEQGKVDFTGIPLNYFLLGLMTTFDNRFQASADKTLGEKAKEISGFISRILAGNSAEIMEKMLNRIPRKDLFTTIRTILKIEDH